MNKKDKTNYKFKLRNVKTKRPILFKMVAKEKYI